MAPQNADSESMQGQESPVPLPALQRHGSSAEARDETGSEGSIDRVPVRLWVMHGAVMFGREFCYAMETALVTPILLQIGKSACTLGGLSTEHRRRRCEHTCEHRHAEHAPRAEKRQEPWELVSWFLSLQPALAVSSRCKRAGEGVVLRC